MKYRPKVRHLILLGLLCAVWLTQWIPALGGFYAGHLYPAVSWVLSLVSGWIPFAVGDLFIFLSIVGLLAYPVYGRIRRIPWRTILLREGEYLLWIYVWFYLAWGLNYSQPDFYRRTQIPYQAYTPQNFREFVDEYVDSLNSAYVSVEEIDKELVRDEAVRLYTSLSDSLGVLAPPHSAPRAKTMLFTPLVSRMGVTGSMGPFFCEFTLNGDLLPINYPFTYAHELAHLLGISSEAEANFYAYQVCTRSLSPEIRFSGYFSLLNYVLGNAARLLPEAEFAAMVARIRPEVVAQAQANRDYWMAKYTPLLGDVQDRVYDLYLKGNKIESGRENYSEVVGLLISYREWQKRPPGGDTGFLR